jgi:hypothetical protein
MQTDNNARAALGRLTPITKFKAYLQRAKHLADNPSAVTGIDNGVRVICDIDSVTAIAKHLADSINTSSDA